MTLYSRWDAAGRPITPAQPVEDLVGKLKAAYPAGARQFSWYANDAHYQAVPPQDHTPYSADAWPISPCPQWYVFATDVMVAAVGGVAEADKLFRYWLAEAKSGRAPWIKYLIWQGHIYDVRHGWAQQSADGHFDHIHVSVRTDHQHTSLGGWSVTPGGDMATSEQLDAVVWSVGRGAPTQPGAAKPGMEAMTFWAGHVTERLARIEQQLDLLLAREPGGDGLVPHTHAVGETGPAQAD